MFSPTKPVPWKNWEEWEKVYNLLFSDNENEILRGCYIVSAWSAKHLIPISIEVTASLQKELHSKRNVNALSLAVIRFINGVIEPYKNSNLSASIQSIGEECQIPEYIISIRHMATHGKLPTFEFAAQGAMAALQWLRTHYWEEQLGVIRRYSSDAKKFIHKYFRSGNCDIDGIPNNILVGFYIPEFVKFLLNNRVVEYEKYALDFVRGISSQLQFLRFAVTCKLLELSQQNVGNSKSWFDSFVDVFLIDLAYEPWIPYTETCVCEKWHDSSIGNLPINTNDDLTLSPDDIDFV